MANKSESEPKAGATALSPPKNGKREGEEEDEEKQVSAKKQKRDEVAEEQKSKEDKKPEAKNIEPATGYGSSESSDNGSLEYDSDRSSDEDYGEMDIDVSGGSEERDEEAQKKKTEVLMNAASNAERPDLKTVTKDTSRDTDSLDDDNDEDDHDHDHDSCDDTEHHMFKKPVKDPESSEYGEEELEEEASKTPQERPRTPATRKDRYAASKTIYVRNLSFSVERADMENLFKDCGEIVDVRLHTDHEGRFRGFGHVEFATAEAAQKALELDNTELLRCPIIVGIALEKSEYISNRSNLSNSFRKGERFQSLTVFVKGFDTSLVQEKIKASLEEHFSSCGEIMRISIPEFRDSGVVKGFAHLEFKDVDSLKKALQLHQTELGGYPLAVEKAKPRRDNQGIDNDRGGGGYRFGGRDRDGYGDGRDRGGGGYRFGGRDRDGYGDGRDRGGGGYRFGGRDRDGYGDGRDRGGGGYRFGGRDRGGYGDGRDRGGYGGRVGWRRSGDSGRRHWTSNIPSTDEGTGRKTTFADDDYRSRSRSRY